MKPTARSAMATASRGGEQSPRFLALLMLPDLSGVSS
jgi:hypothetical protein